MPFVPHLRATRHRLKGWVCGLVVAGLAGLVIGQAQAPTLQVLSRESRRALPIVNAGSQEMVPLDELATIFQLAVRDDGGGLTVGYKGRTIVLTPDQTIASVSGRLISLPAPPARVNGRWLVPLDFIPRGLAPIYDSRLELRRASRLLLVGDVRVPRVTVTYDPSNAATRITLDITPAATSAVTQQGNQRLLVRIDADALDASIPPVQPSPLVQAVRLLDATSLAIDLGPRFASYRASTQAVDAGSRVTIDVAGAQTEALPAAPAAPPGNTAGGTAVAGGTGAAGDPLPRDLTFGAVPTLRTIAIDAGHGGSDTGARGAAGTQEKDVTLGLARRLRAAIESRLGLRVVMTRDDDRDVPLADRVALANNNKADLFISLHVNASFRPEVSGATVYVAAFGDAELAREGLAPEKLPVFGGGLRDIEVVPWNLAQSRHLARSDAFASLVAAAFSPRVPLAARPVEHAPLRVLEPANMPAVLIETAYLTNADQEKAVSGGDLPAALTQAVFDAIVRFRDQAPASDGVTP